MESNQTDIVDFAQQVELEFMRLYEYLDIGSAPERRKADMIDSLWTDIYKIVFKPDIDDIKYNNQNSKLKTYRVHDIESVCDMFIKLNKRYGGVIKFNQFANLTGIHRYTLYLWHKANKSNGYIFNLSTQDVESEGNNIYIYSGDKAVEYRGNINRDDDLNASTIRFDVIKKLQEEMQDSNTNGLSNDTMGHAMRANNEDELGKLYEPRRMQQQEQIKLEVRTAEQIAAKYGLELPDNEGKS